MHMASRLIFAGTSMVALSAAGAAMAQQGAPPSPIAQPVSAAMQQRTALDDGAYYWIDDAYSLLDAIGDAPPDFTFAFDRGEAWGWRTDSGYELYAEPLSDNTIRYYYFEPDNDSPFFVQDERFGFGYRDGRLAAVYDSDGQALSAREGGLYRTDAARLYSRARAIHAAAQDDGEWDSIDASYWAQQVATVIEIRLRWSNGVTRHSGWKRWHDRPGSMRRRGSLASERNWRWSAGDRFRHWQQGGFQGPPPRFDGDRRRPGRGVRPPRPGQWQPGVGRPSVPGQNRPAVGGPQRPGAGRPDAGRPQHPGHGRPGAGAGGSERPGGERPDAGRPPRPDGVQPGAGRPHRPGESRPDAGRPETGRPDRPGQGDIGRPRPGRPDGAAQPPADAPPVVRAPRRETETPRPQRPVIVTPGPQMPLRPARPVPTPAPTYTPPAPSFTTPPEVERPRTLTPRPDQRSNPPPTTYRPAPRPSYTPPATPSRPEPQAAPQTFQPRPAPAPRPSYTPPALRPQPQSAPQASQPRPAAPTRPSYSPPPRQVDPPQRDTSSSD